MIMVSLKSVNPINSPPSIVSWIRFLSNKNNNFPTRQDFMFFYLKVTRPLSGC